MSELTGSDATPSTVLFAALEARFRLHVQGWLQDMLDAEVNDFLGRMKSERRSPEAAPGTPDAGYRNGHGKPRHLTTAVGTLTVSRPRLRGLDERFVSRVLPLFARRTPAVEELLPNLYLHGLSTGDFDQAMRGLLGDEAALSPSTLVRLKAKWQQEYDAWRQRSLADREVVYLWVDGIYVKAGLEKEKAALLVAVAALSDGSKVILAVEAGVRESTESWSRLLRSLKERGMKAPRLVIGDGNLGLWGALANVYPEAGEQRCWNHRIVNVLDRVPQKKQAQVAEWLRLMMYAPTKEKAEAEKGKFQRWCEGQEMEAAGKVVEEDWERMVAYYSYPKEHWVHLRTTNPVESPFAAVRLRTSAAKRYKRVENASAMIWKLLLVGEPRFRKLNAPELMAKVAAGATYINGIRSWPESQDGQIAA